MKMMLLYRPNQKSISEIMKFSIPKEDEVLWAHFDASRKNKLEEVIDALKVHPYAKKVMLNSTHSPRVDVYDKEAFVSCFAIKENYEFLKINLLIGRNYILSYTENSETGIFNQLEEDFKEHPQHMSKTGHILYHVLDKISMFYLKVVDMVSDEIEALEKKVFKTPFANEIGKGIYNWKGRLHDLRQIVEAHDNVIKTIGRSKFPFINEDAGFYFQDLLDNFNRVTAAFDAFREDLMSIFDLQMSLKSDHMNEIMKTLTLVSVVFIPMTFIAGLYGMNFENMPELKWRFGYFYALALMFGLGAGIALYFRGQGWWGESKSSEKGNKKNIY